MAAGMNWGIVSLLIMIVLVLGSVAGFFVFLMRRAAAVAKLNAEAEGSEDTKGLLSESGFASEAAAGRGHFGHVSALAQQRKRCTRFEDGPSQVRASRGRS
jgi:hypothetical protein